MQFCIFCLCLGRPKGFLLFFVCSCLCLALCYRCSLCLYLDLFVRVPLFRLSLFVLVRCVIFSHVFGFAVFLLFFCSS